MAIQFSFTDQFGGVNTTAYARVTALHLLAGGGGAIEADIFRDQTAAGGGYQQIQHLRVGIDPATFATYFGAAVWTRSTNPLRQAYLYLLNEVPLFSGGQAV